MDVLLSQVEALDDETVFVCSERAFGVHFSPLFQLYVVFSLSTDGDSGHLLANCGGLHMGLIVLSILKWINCREIFLPLRQLFSFVVSLDIVYGCVSSGGFVSLCRCWLHLYMKRTCKKTHARHNCWITLVSPLKNYFNRKNYILHHLFRKSLTDPLQYHLWIPASETLS